MVDVTKLQKPVLAVPEAARWKQLMADAAKDVIRLRAYWEKRGVQVDVWVVTKTVAFTDDHGRPRVEFLPCIRSNIAEVLAKQGKGIRS